MTGQPVISGNHGRNTKITVTANSVISVIPKKTTRYVHNGWPHVVQLGDKELFALYRTGQASMSGEGRILKARSMDGGESWSQEGPVWTDAKPLWDYRSPWITRLRDGSLAANCVRFDHSGKDVPLYDGDTEGYLPCENLTMRSVDGGHTWSDPQVVPLPDDLVGNFTCPPVELPDGRFMQPFDTWKAVDDPDPPRQRSMALWSRDDGRSWTRTSVLADGYADNRFYWDGRVVPLGAVAGNQSLFVLYWTYDTAAKTFLQIHNSRSEDSGSSWSEPASTNLSGQTCYSVFLGGESGREKILAVYSERESDSPGLYAALSEDGGRTWNVAGRTLIWDAVGNAEAGDVDRTTKLSEHVSIAFGRPTAFRLKSGDTAIRDVGAAFWGTRDGSSQCRWVRLKVS